MLKRSYDSIFKDHYFCAFGATEYVDMLNVQKTVHYCSTLYAPPLSKLFSIKPLLPTSAVCSDWPAATGIVIGEHYKHASEM